MENFTPLSASIGGGIDRPVGRDADGIQWPYRGY